MRPSGREPSVFVDTNVLVYAHDRSAGERRERAANLLAELWTSGQGRLSVQVLQEFYVCVTRKIPKPLDTDRARAIVADLALWHVHVPRPADVLGAIALQERFSPSFRRRSCKAPSRWSAPCYINGSSPCSRRRYAICPAWYAA